MDIKECLKQARREVASSPRFETDKKLMVEKLSGYGAGVYTEWEDLVGVLPSMLGSSELYMGKSVFVALVTLRHRLDEAEEKAKQWMERCEDLASQQDSYEEQLTNLARMRGLIEDL